MSKLIKFPLEMENGAKVRSIEELRENADVKSIVAYFLDGRLGRWCNAWRYDGLPEKLEDTTCEMIKNIYDVLEIPVDDSQIEAYVKENGIHVSDKSVADTENDEEIIDDEELKNKLKSYVNPDVNLSDYAIDLLPVNSTLTVVRILIKKDSSRYNFIHDAKIGFQDDWIYQNIASILLAIHTTIHSNSSQYSSPSPKIPLENTTTVPSIQDVDVEDLVGLFGKRSKTIVDEKSGLILNVEDLVVNLPKTRAQKKAERRDDKKY